MEDAEVYGQHRQHEGIKSDPQPDIVVHASGTMKQKNLHRLVQGSEGLALSPGPVLTDVLTIPDLRYLRSLLPFEFILERFYGHRFPPPFCGRNIFWGCRFQTQLS